MKQLLVATTNLGKLREIRKLYSQLPFEIFSLSQIKYDTSNSVPETGKTFRDNAIIKAKSYGKLVEYLTLAEDSGLEVDALGGKPGIESKRFGNSDAERIDKLLALLASTPINQRTARFVCNVALFNPSDQTVVVTEGIVSGSIATTKTGDQGFGYDPVFIPDAGNGKTFAQLGVKFKNTHSHRAQALELMKPHLLKLETNP